ncbi:thioredoxin domain-containing protein [Alkalibacterium iburiense]|uniref:Thioredoxin domain-containing protein n=1 Tax=Alkalibacterium iburiense TaxID=290589 RepID=A0ABN0XB75_9LACT
MASDEKEFLKLAEDFERISPKQANELLEADGEVVILVARETCPYCRKFMPKIHKVAQKNNKTVYFIHSQDEQYYKEIEGFRRNYDMPTVPSLLYKNDDGHKTVSDSSMSEKEIAEFINVS